MSEKKNTGKKAVIAVIVIALIVVIIALAVVISGKSKKGGSKSATEAGTEAGSETMRSGQFDIDYAKQVTKLADDIADRLARRQQVMLFINKRGYNSFVSYRSCGEGKSRTFPGAWHRPSPYGYARRSAE